MIRHLRRIAVAFVGGVVLAVGVALLVLPGPAVIVIPAGLAILATEFRWARRLLRQVREQIARWMSLFRRTPTAKGPRKLGLKGGGAPSEVS